MKTLFPVLKFLFPIFGCTAQEQKSQNQTTINTDQPRRVCKTMEYNTPVIKKDDIQSNMKVEKKEGFKSNAASCNEQKII